MAGVFEKSNGAAPQPVVRSEADRPVRAKRIPFGAARSKLGVTMSVPGYHLHWVNDAAGRVAEAQAGGYTFVEPKEVGDAASGTQVKRLVGTQEDGSALYAYLMKIEDEFYAEDQKLNTKIADEFEQAIRRGKLDEKAGDHRYNGGIKIS